MGAPKCQICCVLGLFFRAFPFSASSSLLTLSLPLRSHFSGRPSLPQMVNKNLSYRGQNALNVVKTHERNNDSEHILYVSVRQSRLAGGIMFSTCPFVRPSVCLSVTNL